MFIKLTKSVDLQPLYLNTKAISSVTTANKTDGGGSRVFLIGEVEPWYVAESVEEVMDCISPIKLDFSEVFEQ